MSKTKSNIDLHDDIEKIKSAITQTTDDLKYTATELYSDSINQAKEKTTNYIAERPLTSLGVAVGVGVLIGLLLRK